VFDDATDRLVGGAGLDLFFAGAGDAVNGRLAGEKLFTV
jgi:hypothetical protein